MADQNPVGCRLSACDRGCGVNVTEVHVFALLLSVNLILGLAVWDGGRTKRPRPRGRAYKKHRDR